MRFFSIFCLLLLLCGSVQIVTATETYMLTRQWGGATQFNYPHGIAVDSAGTVYVIDTNNDRISFFTKAGLPGIPSSIGGVGSGNGQFFYPQGIAVDSAKNIYVADTGNHQVQELSSDGTFTKWGIKGSQDAQFINPGGVAVDSAKTVYVADTGNNRIQKFTSTSTFVTKWGSYGSGTGQFSSPRSVAVDRYGFVYVADTGNNRIQKFTSTGVLVATWGSSGSGAGQFNTPSGIAVDIGGSVYVSDTGNNRIQKFTSSGEFITSWGSAGSGAGQFASPCGIAVDKDGAVYVADTDNDRIQKFVTAPATLTFVPGTKTMLRGDSQPLNLILSGVGNGLSGYSVTLSVDDPSVLEIVDAQTPEWAIPNNSPSSPPSQTVMISGADSTDLIKGRMSNISLGSLTIKAKLPGIATLNVIQYKLDDDLGNMVQVSTISTVITVDKGVVQLLGVANPPGDLDHDGLYEDVNGNGVADFNDVVLYFNQIEWIGNNEPNVAFDFNRNGRIDFGDVVTLFNMM